MKLKFFSVGKDRSGLFSPGVAEYLGRLGHYATVEVFELPESKSSGQRAKEDEAEIILSKLKPKDVLVALDERGKSLTSVEFASWVGKHHDSSRDLAFVIGGDEGLSEALVSKAALVLSLSKMTLPHRLARLMLAEQVYRAFTISRKEPYHK